MGEMSEFALPVRLFLKAYRWRRIDPVPWTPLRKPLRDSRLALISSAAFVLPEQEPFDESIRGGDPSFREIPSHTDPTRLTDMHRSESFDHTGMQADPNLAFPIDRARELVDRGRIGSLARNHLSFMGSILGPDRFVRETGPAAVQNLVADGVDVALLVPV